MPQIDTIIPMADLFFKYISNSINAQFSLLILLSIDVKFRLLFIKKKKAGVIVQWGGHFPCTVKIWVWFPASHMVP